MILLPQELIVRHADKAYPLPYENMSVRSFRDICRGGELVPKGSWASILVDPLVMYWNATCSRRRVFPFLRRRGMSFSPFVPMLTKIDNVRNVLRSGVSFGEFKC